MDTVFWQLTTAWIGSLGFSLLFHLRKGLLFPASLGGLFSWGIYLLGMAVWDHIFIACLTASAFAAFYAEVLARILKAPTPLFFIPAVVPLIPGNPLYQTMSYAVRGEWAAAQHNGFVTIQYALSIALGMSLVWTFFMMGTRLRFYWKNRHVFLPKEGKKRKFSDS